MVERPPARPEEHNNEYLIEVRLRDLPGNVDSLPLPVSLEPRAVMSRSPDDQWAGREAWLAKEQLKIRRWIFGKFGISREQIESVERELVQHPPGPANYQEIQIDGGPRSLYINFREAEEDNARRGPYISYSIDKPNRRMS